MPTPDQQIDLTSDSPDVLQVVTNDADQQVGINNASNNGNESTNGSESPRKMTRAEAGRKGGLSTKKRYGEDYFSEIGRMGGKKGGESTKRRYGVEFYQEIGRKGGSR